MKNAIVVIVGLLFGLWVGGAVWFSKIEETNLIVKTIVSAVVAGLITLLASLALWNLWESGRYISRLGKETKKKISIEEKQVIRKLLRKEKIKAVENLLAILVILALGAFYWLL